jgi:hypothetical protein
MPRRSWAVGSTDTRAMLHPRRTSLNRHIDGAHHALRQAARRRTVARGHRALIPVQPRRGRLLHAHWHSITVPALRDTHHALHNRGGLAATGASHRARRVVWDVIRRITSETARSGPRHRRCGVLLGSFLLCQSASCRVGWPTLGPSCVAVRMCYAPRGPRPCVARAPARGRVPRRARAAATSRARGERAPPSCPNSSVTAVRPTWGKLAASRLKAHPVRQATHVVEAPPVVGPTRVDDREGFGASLSSEVPPLRSRPGREDDAP